MNHLALTVTDLDVSERFYTDVIDFLCVLDVGYGRVCLHKATGFSIALLRPTAGSRRAELVAWEDRLREAGVPYPPIQDVPLGHHLNFRDPDALELQAPSDTYAAALAELRTRDVSDSEVLDIARQLVGSDLVPR